MSTKVQSLFVFSLGLVSFATTVSVAEIYDQRYPYRHYPPPTPQLDYPKEEYLAPYVRNAVFSNSGRWLAVGFSTNANVPGGANDNFAGIWDWETRREIQELWGVRFS
jgi:energy-converting hydrogenase Eha subunit F